MNVVELRIGSNLIHILIYLAILANGMGLLYPILRNDDPALYATIAKHIAISGDWINLISNNYDWLDKPHFPFWVTAVSFKLLGINSFAYILPGFLFNLIGAYYTYKLAWLLYDDELTGLLSALIYLTSLHLMISSIDVRAEAYLLGEIVPAAYYWLLYDKQSKIKYLLLGALFSALAVMTKGIFVLITIASGMLGMWLFLGEWRKIFSFKWISAIGVILIFILPEIISLYIQFDMHPDKLLFGHTGVSGVKFFFWDSQFGRFFNSGPITNTHGNVFFFIHTFLWAFLPWSLVFIASIILAYKTMRSNKLIIYSKEQRVRAVYLVCAFFPTFILFSLTKFQLDHYTNILMPFAAILVAHYLLDCCNEDSIIYKLQQWLGYLLIALVIILTLILYKTSDTMALVNTLAIIVILMFYEAYRADYTNLAKAVVYPSLAICIVFMFISAVNGTINIKYDAGYQIAQYLNTQSQIPVIDYKVDSLTLEFHARDEYRRMNNIEQLLAHSRPYYLVVKQDDVPELQKQLLYSYVVYQIGGTTIDKVMANLLNLKRLNTNLTQYSVILVP